MAKQTFTTGQVLTAAQMTALQQTAMLGGAASAKVASYVLVAADAGDAITMSNASPTTITVNTGLFAEGDIVTIINIGSGACTITAGTATVTTSGSLVLAQNQGGVLRFTSASAAIFFQFATPASGDIEGVTAGTGISGGGTSGTVTITNSMATEITAKGDLIVGTGNATFDNLPVGTNGHTLVADSGETTGLKWAAPASGGQTLLSTTTLSGTSTTISSIDQTYKHLLIVARGIYCSGDIDGIIRLNSDTGSNYTSINAWSAGVGAANVYTRGSIGGSSIGFFAAGSTNDYDNNGYIRLNIYRYSETEYKLIEFISAGFTSSYGFGSATASYNSTTAISSLTFGTGSAVTFSGGTIYIYGVK